MFDVVAGETVNARDKAQGKGHEEQPNTRHEAQGTGHKEIQLNKIYLPFTSRGIVSVLLNLIYLLRYQKGIFHITGDVHYALLVLPKDRTILTIHDLVFMHTYKGIRRAILKWIFLDMPIRRAKFITTISEKSKQEIIDFTGCSAEKIMVIPNPVSIGKEAKRQGGNTAIGKEAKRQGGNTAIGKEAKRQGGKEVIGNRHEAVVLNSPFPRFSVSPSPTLLFLGTKVNKNLEATIAALFGLDVHLRIIGKMERHQKELLHKFKINYSNAFNLSDEELHQEYLNADIVLFPSTYEGFGLPIIEGFQLGKPVITSNIPPMIDVAKGAAMLVNPYSIASIRDGVKSLINDITLKQELITKGSEVVKKYQPSYIAGIYADLWKKVEGVEMVEVV